VRLHEKVAIVTGSAGGLGLATVRAFAREGATVVVTDVLDDEGTAAVARIEEEGGRACYERLDVTDAAAWQDVVDRVVARYGGLDILVNNAGISGTGDADPMSEAFFDRLIDINTRGAFLGIRSAAPAMIRAGRGSIVNLSSVMGHYSSPGQHLGYTASKGAITSMTRAAAVSLGASGIRVNSVAPGLLPPMRSAKLSASPEWMDGHLRRIPLGRAGESSEVAAAVLFLASDEASYITGVEITVDGGLTAVI